MLENIKEGIMKCPHCNTELEEVTVISRCWQKATLNSKGSIEDYGSLEEILDTISIHCPHCDQDITDLVKES